MNRGFLNQIFLILIIIININSSSLEILKSKSHDLPSNIIPLVISLSSKNGKEKKKGVDIFCIWNVYGTISEEAKNLGKESLKYLINLMNDQDNLALIGYDYTGNLTKGLTKMTPENKTKILNDLDILGSTSISGGLEEGLNLINGYYSLGDRIASMILLSDQTDNWGEVSNFIKLLDYKYKKDYTFTLHTVGFGYHNANLMYSLSHIKDGLYFSIKDLSMVQDAFLKIYSALSTVNGVDIKLVIDSKYGIKGAHEYEEFYKTSLIGSIVEYNIIHCRYDRKYDFVVLVEIPNNNIFGKKILNVTIPKLNLSAEYYYDERNNSYAYEVYIKYNVIFYFLQAYDTSEGIYHLHKGHSWIIENYRGNKNWEALFVDTIKDVSNFTYNKKENILAPIIRELQYSSMDINNDKENSEQKIIIEHNIDISLFQYNKVTSQKIININQKYNYFYFYLKAGIGIINNMYFLGSGSSVIIYSDNTNEKIEITPVSQSIEYYYWEVKKTRILSEVDFSHRNQFIIQKDSPFEFYTYIDGSRDIVFNIEFLDFNFSGNYGNEEYLFEIIAYIVSDQEIAQLNSTDSYMPTTRAYYGNYDHALKLGKIAIKKGEITQYLINTDFNYLYVIIRKNVTSTITYQYIKGQALFFSTDYIYSKIPENFRIFNNLEEGQSLHLYTLIMEKELGHILRIEFENSGKELDCKILKYQNYSEGSDELYVDNKELNISRTNYTKTIYIDVRQSYYEEMRFEQIIVSIFAKNNGHISSSEISKLSYNLKYTTFSGFGISRFQVILLGFSRFIYIKQVKKYSFFVNFARTRGKINSTKLIVSLRIKYKITNFKESNDSSDIEVKNLECIKKDIYYDNQLKYNCTFQKDKDDYEIEDLQIDKNMLFENQNVEISASTAIANLTMDKLQTIGEDDPFDKKLFILDNCSLTMDDKSNKFNLTGQIDDKNFDYEELNLTINPKTGEIENIYCDIIKSEVNNIILSCNPKSKIENGFEGAFSDLGKENLIINFPSDPIKGAGHGDSPTSEEDGAKNHNNEGYYFHKNKTKGLSPGAIVGIILPCLAIVIIIIIIILFAKGKKPIFPENKYNTNNSQININK